MESEKTYICIDLKSFYASVECLERGLDPLQTNLVVADDSRTDKTICLAVTPALKSFGVPGRPRLFEVKQTIKELNYKRSLLSKNKKIEKASWYLPDLQENPSRPIDFIVAPPQMARYVKVSTEIYGIYLKYIMPEDIHVYSIDEVFIDLTHYITSYKKTARELVTEILKEVYYTIGITATVGIGTNMFLAKVAMDILAKKMPPNEDGVRIAELDEIAYREKLWNHSPLTDFWRVGNGYARKLESKYLFTMGDIARCSVGDPKGFYNEELLYKMFGVNAELLIDHAWGWEPCTIKDIREYKPERKSLGSGQVLQSAYLFDDAKLVLREMADNLVLDLVEKSFCINQVVISVGYDGENLEDKELAKKYTGEVKINHYGKAVPKHAHGTVNFEKYTSSSNLIINAVMKKFDEIVCQEFTIRRLSISANNVVTNEEAIAYNRVEQLDLFSCINEKDKEEDIKLEKEKNIQKTILDIKRKYGKNAILKGMNYLEGATAKERNNQIGGHRAGS